MIMNKYPDEWLDWIRENSSNREWENLKAFTDAFNSHFNLDKSVKAIASVMTHNKISINSRCNNSFYTDEQKKWISENLGVIEWRNQKHFVDTFNALFGTSKTPAAMNTYLYNHGLTVRTHHNTNHWTAEMDTWLAQHYDEYDCYFVRMAKDFNSVFGTEKSACCITKHLQRLGIHRPLPKGAIHHHGDHTGRAGGNKNARNRGLFQKGAPSKHGELPIGTIRYNSDGRPFIKVQLCEGRNSHSEGGHNYKEPWWKPLQKKIWEDHYGEVPDGYIVCTLNGDPNDTDIRNIGIIDKRGTAQMAKNGWWTDNRVLTGTGVQWCNLFYTVKDEGG